MEPLLTSHFDEALRYALTAHASQTRKGTAIPYAAHLFAVASLILEAGGSEDAAIAGLLHDVIEDQGPHHLDEIAAHFGDQVASAVVECSAESKHDGLSWTERKQRYIDQMTIASPLALTVSLADKVHNLRAIVADYRVLGHELFTRFGAPGPEAIVCTLAGKNSVEVVGESGQIARSGRVSLRPHDEIIDGPKAQFASGDQPIQSSVNSR